MTYQKPQYNVQAPPPHRRYGDMANGNFVCVAQSQSVKGSATLSDKLAEELAQREPKLIVTFLSPQCDGPALNQSLKARWPNAARLTSSSGGEFTGAHEGQGAVVWALGGDIEVRTGFAGEVQQDLNAAVERLTQDIPDTLEGYPHRVGIVLLDPLSGCAEEATLTLAMTLEQGAPIRLVGGAAADDFALSTPIVGVGDALSQDALGLAVIYSKTPFGIGVRHGYTAQSGDLHVTRASGNVVYEINHRPAWDVWVEESKKVAQARGLEFIHPDKAGETNFFCTYQCGLRFDADELKIRAPLKRLDEGAIQFAGALARGARISITCGSPTAQIESAQKAANDAKRQLEGAPAAGLLVFDCICRKMILQKEFFKAVHAASEVFDHLPLAGFETYGEIALKYGDFSGFHNTTTVVLAVPA